ncbi:HAUS augmin-like complex subunit 6 [Linnemannia hyalina]|uniref:HAUS augmin-like complex subunit 6 n=1 Tax=Linnemannia hyalina TaxID=64524 RepID=A0A9P8BTX6_9FUNG|nr:HAUS augmin-like complex subunit 6 [Linnemannia hyalina]
MSTTHPSTGTPPLHYLASPENIRSIFFTNLVLLGVHEYSSAFAQKPGSHHHLVETAAATAAHHGFNKSRLGTLASSFEPQSMTRSISRQQHLQQPIIIDSYGYDASGNTRPLELHRHVLAKGHQSTKALEFILWFLFTRLDKTQTRDRFKECWPVIDRHDAREFRNVAFKWLEELRKDGCFGIGHQLARDDSSATFASNNHNTNGNTGSLGLFLPTIRRSYLDESIGERIEQLVLVLSTYVLSTVIKKEKQMQAESDRTLRELISHVPESSQDEATLLEMIDSQIVRRSQPFLRDVQKQKAVRLDWSLKSQEMCSRLNTISRELTNVESERRMFLVHQPHIADRTGLLSLEELRVLEDRWIEKINDRWRPILRYVELHVGRKDILQALLDADSGSGSSVLDRKRLQKDDLSMTLGHLTNHDNHGGPSVDLVSILMTWKHSLLQLENGAKQKGNNSEASAAVTQGALENLSRSHAKQLVAIKGTRTRLESRLNEVTQRVQRLKKEKKIQERPYRRLLSTIATTESHEGNSFGTSSLTTSKDIHKEAEATAAAVFSALATTSSDNALPSTRHSDIRKRIRVSAAELLDNQPSTHRSLLESYRGQDVSDVLLVRAPTLTVPKPNRSPVRPSRTDPFRSPAATLKPAAFKPITYKPITVKPYTTTAAATSTPTAIASARSVAKIPSSIIKPPASPALSRTGLTESKASIEFPKKRSLAKESSIMPAPDDLVVRGSTRVTPLNETVCKDIVDLLTEDSVNAVTPPVTTLNNRRPIRPIQKAAQNIATQRMSPTSKRTELWTSLFRGRDLDNRTGTNSHSSGETAKLTPSDHQPAQSTETVLNTSFDRIQPIQEPTLTSPTIPSTRSIFRGRLGVSRKRRQSSDFQPGRSTTPLQPVSDEPHETLLWQKDAVQPAKPDNLFQESDDEPPGTPSKRRRTDSVLGRRTSFVYDTEVATKDDPVHQPTTPVSKTPERSALLKALRSPKLTLDDLRAPTPKPNKTKNGESMAMPLMLLHTPQQKLLFQMEAGLIPKVTNPFTSLTPSSLIDPKGKSTFMSPTQSPFKRPAFSTSIFARFKSNPDPERQEEHISPADPPVQTPTRPSLWDPTSPFAPSPTPVKITRTPPAAPPVLTKSIDRKPLTTTSILKHLLNGNSVVLDRMCDKVDNGTVNSAPLPTNMATVPPVTAPSVATPPRFQAQREEHTEIHPVRQHADMKKAVEIKKATVPSIPDGSTAVASLKVKQNPWGRPPSWTPNQPLMIDMDMKKTPQAERTRRLAAKSAGIGAPSFGSLAKSSMGSLKVSVFGRSKHGSVQSSNASVSASYSSLSSVSSRSLHSNFSLLSSVSGPGVAQRQLFGGADVENEEVEDDPDNDTRGFSPPAVSPIRGSDPELFKSFAESMMMSTRQRAENETPRFHIPSRPAQRQQQQQRTVSVHADEPNEIESIVAESSLDLHEQEAESRQFLDEPMPEYEDGDEEGGGGEGLTRHGEAREDETIMNYALQPIFGSGGGSRMSVSKSTIPRFFGSSSIGSRSSMEGADRFSSGARLSHDSHDRHLSRNEGRSEEEKVTEEEHGEVRDGMMNDSEADESMMIGGLFDEMMPEGLDPNETLWENTELFS